MGLVRSGVCSDRRSDPDFRRALPRDFEGRHAETGHRYLDRHGRLVLSETGAGGRFQGKPPLISRPGALDQRARLPPDSPGRLRAKRSK